MLSFVKISCLIIGIAFLAGGIFFRFLSGDIIGLLLIGASLFIDRHSKSHPSAAKSIASLLVVMLGIFVFKVTQLNGALPNIDTTGEIPTSATVTGLVLAIAIIVVGLVLVNRPKR